MMLAEAKPDELWIKQRRRWQWRTKGQTRNRTRKEIPASISGAVTMLFPFMQEDSTCFGASSEVAYPEKRPQNPPP